MSMDPRDRFKAYAKSEPQQWFRIQNKANDVVRIDIYDYIDSWGEPYGVSAKDFVKKLSDVKASTIELHINSPGGEVYDGLAIFHALRDHDAQVHTIVDGLAASAASFIALAGDTVTMNSYAQMMCHDAWGVAMGNATDLQKAAQMLDKTSETIASIYADFAGGTVSSWRDVMKEETWYNAEEAVQAGLANDVREAKKKDASADESKVENSFDLSPFKYQGRSHAPKPPTLNTLRENRVSFPTESNTVDSNATEVTPVPDELEQPGTEGENETVTPDPESPEPATPEQPETPAVTPGETETEVTTTTSTPQASLRLPEGVTAVDTAAFNTMQQRLAALEKETALAKKEKHEAVKAAAINNAVSKGKIAPSRKEAYALMFDTDPTGTADVLKQLPDNTFPVEEIGHSESIENSIDEDQYPSDWKNSLVVPGKVF